MILCSCASFMKEFCACGGGEKKAGALWICIVLKNNNLLGFLVGEKW